jgi:hypothetical protein
MTVQRTPSMPKPGDKLSNDRIVLDYIPEDAWRGKVLCLWQDEFVVWSWHDGTKATTNGKYFDNLTEAIECLHNRHLVTIGE